MDFPILIGEYHCGALEADCNGLKGGKGSGRARSDVAVFSGNDGENYKGGMADVCMQPYPELMGAAGA